MMKISSLPMTWHRKNFQATSSSRSISSPKLKFHWSRNPMKRRPRSPRKRELRRVSVPLRRKGRKPLLPPPRVPLPTAMKSSLLRIALKHSINPSLLPSESAALNLILLLLRGRRKRMTGKIKQSKRILLRLLPKLTNFHQGMQLRNWFRKN